MELAKLNRAAARKNKHTDWDARRLHGALWPRWCFAANASYPASLKSHPGLILDSRGQSTVYQAGVIWVSWLTEETGWKREDGAAAGGAPPAPPPLLHPSSDDPTTGARRRSAAVRFRPTAAAARFIRPRLGIIVIELRRPPVRTAP